MLGLGMWVFSAKFNKNYFSYLVGSHLLMKKTEITEKMPIFTEGTIKREFVLSTARI
jgi:hypothetical protein